MVQLRVKIDLPINCIRRPAVIHTDTTAEQDGKELCPLCHAFVHLLLSRMLGSVTSLVYSPHYWESAGEVGLSLGDRCDRGVGWSTLSLLFFHRLQQLFVSAP